MPDADMPFAPSREILLAGHTFPGEFLVKAFGPATSAFETAVHEAATVVLGAARVRGSGRATASGEKICWTLTLSVDTVDEVHAVYRNLHTVSGLFLLL